MIFVTVGTDHHPFDRLVKKIDSLKKECVIEEKVFIQSGASSYKPRFCEFAEFLPFDQMMAKIDSAKIVITHGGPGSIMPVLYRGKTPIVVPRLKKFGEAIDDHQFKFVLRLETRNQIIASKSIEDLEQKIKNYEQAAQKLRHSQEKTMSSSDRVSCFARALDEICLKLLGEKKC